jgi:GABA(A) receptor-associated protein
MSLSKISTLINNTIKRNVNDYLDKDSLEFDFKNKISLEDRKHQSNAIMKKYPNRLPIICNVSKKLPKLDKHKYLIPNDLQSTTFFFIIRKRLKLKEGTAMYFFVNGKVLIANSYMSENYNKYKDEDGFLYIYICAENTFG